MPGKALLVLKLAYTLAGEELLNEEKLNSDLSSTLAKDVCNVCREDLSCAMPETLASTSFVFRSIEACLAAFSASTIAVTIFLVSKPAPTPIACK